MEPEHEQALLRTGASPPIESSDNQPQEHTDLLSSRLRSTDPDPEQEDPEDQTETQYFASLLPRNIRFWFQQHLGRVLIVVSAISILAILALLIAIALITWQLVVLDTSTISVNIHLQISSQCETVAQDYNTKIQKLDPTEAINLTTLQLPHITLYLTNFMYLKYSDIDHVMTQLVPKFTACNVTMTDRTTVSGSYVMWDVLSSSCLQHMSDAIVNETSAFIQQNQPVPDWVHNISDPTIREKKILYVQKFGSPNVFDMFSPHVTLAADDKSPAALADAASKLSISSCTFFTEKIALGTVGEFGTVLRNEKMTVYTIGSSSTTTTT